VVVIAAAAQACPAMFEYEVRRFPTSPRRSKYRRSIQLACVAVSATILLCRRAQRRIVLRSRLAGPCCISILNSLSYSVTVAGLNYARFQSRRRGPASMR
jgi:hypothetical protein